MHRLFPRNRTEPKEEHYGIIKTKEWKWIQINWDDCVSMCILESNVAKRNDEDDDNDVESVNDFLFCP